MNPGAESRRPSRVALLVAIAFAFIVAIVCVRLGFWQLDRLGQRRAVNEVLQAAGDLPPLHLDSATLAEIASNPDGFIYRHATATGHVHGSEAVLLRGRADTGRPGVHLAVPLEVDGWLVIANLGWLSALDGATTDPRPYIPRGDVTVSGVLVPLPPPDSDPQERILPAGDTTVTTLRRIDTRFRDPGPITALSGVYLERTAGVSSDEMRVLAVPMAALDDGPHLSYAVQWFSFALIALFGAGVLLVLLRRRGKAVQPS